MEEIPGKALYDNSIYWVEVDRIKPNPYQPRKEFDQMALASLAESIRQYGVLQPLTVTRKETEIPGEGIRVEYELIAGERRLRASKLAGLYQVPVVIRRAEDSDQMKLELAIIENLQREDLNAVDRAKAFKQLVDQFSLKHAEIGKKVGKSREYVSNSLRILLLPQDIQDAVVSGEITEGHTRPLLMLQERPEEQRVLFEDIKLKRLNVRDTEQLARRIATEKTRKGDLTPELLTLERELSDSLGTRVRIEKKEKGAGKLIVEFFSAEDLAHLRDLIAKREASVTSDLTPAEAMQEATPPEIAAELLPPEEPADDLYSARNFTV
ncbi:ParB/RepB/Spo0J family partition protein [bacterium]|nr:ParB/RepB/Spo0J family partition protein [bacterium]